MSCIAEGIAKASDGMIGRDSCLEKSVVNLEAFEIEAADTRGRKEERIEDVVVWIAAIVTDQFPL